MKHEYISITSPLDTKHYSQREEIIQHLNEKYPSPTRPYRHQAQRDESWGQIVYSMAGI